MNNEKLKGLLEEIVETIDIHCFSDCGRYNNEEIIDLVHKLEDLIKTISE